MIDQCENRYCLGSQNCAQPLDRLIYGMMALDIDDPICIRRHACLQFL
jgi:hypothetical protein